MTNNNKDPKLEKAMENYISRFFSALETEQPELFAKIVVMVKQGRAQEVTDVMWPIFQDNLGK